jgi:hypothetical protein
METTGPVFDIKTEYRDSRKSEAVTFTAAHAQTWNEIGLDKYIKQLGVCLVIYLLTLGIFWYSVVTGRPVNPLVSLFFMLFASFNFIFLTTRAYKIQVALKKHGFQKQGGWHVVVGTLLLNPFFLGWYISLSVLIKALLTRRRVMMAGR